MVGARSTYGERRLAYSALVGRPEVNRPLGRPRSRWENNVKIELHEVGWGYGLDRPGSRKGQVSGCWA